MAADTRCQWCDVPIDDRGNKKWCSDACRRKANRTRDNGYFHRTCSDCRITKGRNAFYRCNTYQNETCNACAIGSSPAGRIKLCKSCGALPHRVKGPRCSECGTDYAPLPPVHFEAHLVSNWPQEGLDRS